MTACFPEREYALHVWVLLVHMKLMCARSSGFLCCGSSEHDRSDGHRANWGAG